MLIEWKWSACVVAKIKSSIGFWSDWELSPWLKMPDPYANAYRIGASLNEPTMDDSKASVLSGRATIWFSPNPVGRWIFGREDGNRGVRGRYGRRMGEARGWDKPGEGGELELDDDDDCDDGSLASVDRGGPFWMGAGLMVEFASRPSDEADDDVDADGWAVEYAARRSAFAVPERACRWASERGVEDMIKGG